MNNMLKDILRNVPVQNFDVEGLDIRIVPVATGVLFFVSVDRDIDFPAHKHSPHCGIVVSGKCELTIDNETTTYNQGDTYHIPGGTSHKMKMFAGYSEIAFVNDTLRRRE